MATVEELHDLLSETLADSQAALRQAVHSQNALHLTAATILGPTDGSWNVAAFKAFTERSRDEPGLAAELIAFCAAHRSHLHAELLALVDARLGNLGTLPRLEDSTVQRVSDFVTGREEEPQINLSLLRWIWRDGRRTALEASRHMASLLPEERGADVLRAAAQLGVGEHRDHERVLKLALETATQGDLSFALQLAGYVRACADHDELLTQILSLAAAASQPLGTELNLVIRDLKLERLQRIVEQISPESHSWFVGTLLPLLKERRPRLLADNVAKPWMPHPFVLDLCATLWPDSGMLLAVFKRSRELRRDAHAVSKTRLVERFLSGSEGTEFAGAVLAALTSSVLGGRLPPDDEEVLEAFRHPERELRLEAWRSASWNQAARGHALGVLAMRVDPPTVPELVGYARSERNAPVLEALIDGALETNTESDVFYDVARLVIDSPELATHLVPNAPEAIVAFSECWEHELDMRAFRILTTCPGVEHLDVAAQALTNGDERITDDDRLELLEGLVDHPSYGGVLRAILERRLLVAADQPSPRVLVEALDRIGKAFATGRLNYSSMAGALENICEEHRNRAVREAGYDAIASSKPTEATVQFLLGRATGEAPAAKPAVRRGLSRMADSLEEQIQASVDMPERVAALDMLALIRPAVAVEFARSLISADSWEHRLAMATLVGRHGNRDDADLLRSTFEDEPHTQVQSAVQRAIRHLVVGNIAAAHERLGEMVGLSGSEIEQIDPSSLYGHWSDLLVVALERIDRAVDNNDFGTAIDQLGGELAKILLFRAIEVAGDEVAFSDAQRQQIANNVGDFGGIVRRQQLFNVWRHTIHLGSLYEMRTEHVAARGSTSPVATATAEDYQAALTLFRLGTRGVWDTIAQATRETYEVPT